MQYHKTIKLQQAQRVKTLLVHDSFSNHQHQFRLFPAYLNHLQQINPKVYTNLIVDEDNYQFHCIFICPQTSQAAFVFGLPFVALDRTSLKTQFQQTLLIAVAQDVNNNEMLLAWAIVETELGASWAWFLKHLFLAILEINAIGTTIISNQNQGLGSVGHLMSLVSQAWCCWHIAQNVCHHHENAAKKIFWQLVQAVGQPAWKERLKDLRLTCNESAAVSYVLNIEPKYWATQFFPGQW